MLDQILPGGSSVVVLQNVEDRTRRIDRFDGTPDNAGAALGSETFQYYDMGNLTQIADLIGLGMHQTHDHRGRFESTANAIGITPQLDYDAEVNLVQQTSAHGTPDATASHLEVDALGNATALTDPNSVRAHHWHDDFDCKIAEISPDRGVMLYRHDAAGRKILRIDETGVGTRTTYDHTSRIISRGVDREPGLVRFRYDGMHLRAVTTTEDADPVWIVAQRQSRYDAFR